MGYREAREWLQGRRDPSGGWGYLPGGPPAGEPTLLALAAGLDPVAIPEELGWAELLAPAALPPDGPFAARRRAAVDRVLALRGEKVGETPGTYSGELQGWAWVPGTFSWVEPTAWGVLSLRAAGLGLHPRVAEGIAVLADRQCADGGWNAGTPDILGKELPGYLYATGWVVLALPPGEVAHRGLAFLDGVRAAPSAMGLALAILARLAHGREPAELPGLLAARQGPDGAFGDRVDRTALAACALRAAEGGPRAFAVADG